MSEYDKPFHEVMHTGRDIPDGEFYYSIALFYKDAESEHRGACINNCPFCLLSNVGLDRISEKACCEEEEDGCETYYRVSCGNAGCSASGPHHNTPLGAIGMWNSAGIQPFEHKPS